MTGKRNIAGECLVLCEEAQEERGRGLGLGYGVTPSIR